MNELIFYFVCIYALGYVCCLGGMIVDEKSNRAYPLDPDAPFEPVYTEEEFLLLPFLWPRYAYLWLLNMWRSR